MKKGIPSETLAQYQRVINQLKDVELKTNFGFPYTSLNGHMYSLLSKSGKVGIRLPKKEREAFLEKHGSALYQPDPGPLLKEYVTIPDELLHDIEELLPYLNLSLEYVLKLKPKKKKQANSNS